MTNAIVMNTLTGAVTEYTGFGFQSITPTLAGSATGLFSLGGNLDVDQPIVAVVTTGKTTWGDTLKKFLDMLYYSMKGSGTSTATVICENNTYAYTFPVRSSGESRAKPGRGIRENYMSFSYSNTDGADFRLDRIEAAVGTANTRRV